MVQQEKCFIVHLKNWSDPTDHRLRGHKKVKIIEETGADVLMDLSTGKGIDDVRKEIIGATKLPIGTVPMYQAGKEALDEFKNIAN